MARKRSAHKPDPAAAAFAHGLALVIHEPIFGPLVQRAEIRREPRTLCPPQGWAVVTRNGVIHTHPTRRAEPEEWAYVVAHCLLHLGFSHLKAKAEAPAEWNAACDCFVASFLAHLKFGRPPAEIFGRLELPASSEEALCRQFLESGIPGDLAAWGTAGPRSLDMIWEPVVQAPSYWNRASISWEAAFGRGVALAVEAAVAVAADQSFDVRTASAALTEAGRAQRWFISNFPLLGALAASFTLVEDATVCKAMQIHTAAVSSELKEIYINPLAGLSAAEYRFVLAHEILHVGLRHDVRQQGRDPYLWNVACDYVINHWLIEMRLGQIPEFGLLYDPALGGLSAEAIYERIVTDMRTYRKLATLHGVGVGDILPARGAQWWESGPGLELDEFYRRCLAQGLEYHITGGRGLLPAGLVEEIRALGQPPIPWDVALARWFDSHFPSLERRRSYARLSRRQSASPKIPRPRWVSPVEEDKLRTFGVILDTSGSMDRSLLAKALGAIASYSLARDVPLVRVVFCDATSYDQGYMPPEAIADRVRVRGRGGTVLQPAVDLLERTEDFPQDGPILIITDGECDKLQVPRRREHAYLVPRGRFLPFVAAGEVFYFA